MSEPEPTRPASPRLLQLEALLAREPDDGFILYGLAQECQKLGRLAEALDWYDRTMVADPAQCYASFHKAKVLEELGRRDEAVATLRTGLARARSIQDRKAASEIEAFLDELE